MVEEASKRTPEPKPARPISPMSTETRPELARGGVNEKEGTEDEVPDGDRPIEEDLDELDTSDEELAEDPEISGASETPEQDYDPRDVEISNANARVTKLEKLLHNANEKLIAAAKNSDAAHDRIQELNELLATAESAAAAPEAVRAADETEEEEILVDPEGNLGG
jgi:chromosome segregation ATPase